MKGSGLLSLNLLKTIYYVGTLYKNVSTKRAFPFFFTLKDNVLSLRNKRGVRGTIVTNSGDQGLDKLRVCSNSTRSLIS